MFYNIHIIYHIILDNIHIYISKIVFDKCSQGQVGLCRLIRRDASGLIEYDLDKMGDILIDSPVFIGSPYPVYIHIK